MVVGSPRIGKRRAQDFCLMRANFAHDPRIDRANHNV